ncbi:unnamed protein product [Dovyalis caffra]|uniref:Uncharacterized protein n=1 Tax=Dovyalis caffra TaxID=77055 RepID=A0AAV1SF31_9ROSI|nr:unnamed protein product [Dovyalis caffra]
MASYFNFDDWQPWSSGYVYRELGTIGWKVRLFQKSSVLGLTELALYGNKKSINTATTLQDKQICWCNTLLESENRLCNIRPEWYPDHEEQRKARVGNLARTKKVSANFLFLTTNHKEGGSHHHEQSSLSLLVFLDDPREK